MRRLLESRPGRPPSRGGRRTALAALLVGNGPFQVGSPRRRARSAPLIGALVGLALCLGCDDGGPSTPPAPTGPTCEALSACPGDDAPPSLTAPIVVAPSDALPREVVLLTAHNNLDVVWHDGRLFFALRTAPSHFASTETRLFVVSTTDQVEWRFEGRFHVSRDLREPRFLSLNGRLWMYFAVLGTDPLAFEPGGTRRSEYLGPGEWTPPEDAFGADFIPWRIQVHDGVAYLIGYGGGAGVYTAEGDPLEVEWLKSSDGETWSPVGAQAKVLEGGVSETDFALLDDGAVVAVGRNEAGDADGFGSKICRAEAGALGDWRCATDPRKYDSPLVLTDGRKVWLIARRNVTETGNYDLGLDDLTPEQRWGRYQADYWGKPKRCSLWSVDPQALTVEHVLDLPSAGDTCFASAIPLGARTWLVYNYSSPFEKGDISWLQGQNAETLIYRTTLTVPE